ncbi:hypothetical protein FRC02_010689, partial [Tulasnella sp. 418]
MVQNLAGNLALVTCKEPLRTNMAAHLRSFLAEQGFGADLIPDQAIHLIVADNIDVSCAAIEKAAMDRAVAEVDEAFANAYATRRHHRETRPGQPFWDTTSSPSHFSTSLPDLLRIKPSGLQTQQTRVYDEFGRESSRRPISRPGSAAVPFSRQEFVTQSPAPDAIQEMVPGLTQPQCMERFNQLVIDLEILLTHTGPTPNDVREFLRQTLQTINRSIDPEETALAFSQKTVQLLFKTNHQIGREVYVLLLQKLCEASPKVGKEAIEWLLYAEDE